MLKQKPPPAPQFFNQDPGRTPNHARSPSLLQLNDPRIVPSGKHHRARSQPPSSSRSRATKTSNKAQTKTKLPSKGNKQSSRSSTTPGSHRQPLTQAEKKANHTNSEQRRRDATSRAYAEMYDLVPELESMGKLSTTKKLECVVKKVRELKVGNVALERMLGLE